MGKRKTTEQFIAEARKVHGDEYDYSKVEYVNNNTKVCVICPEHGEFWVLPRIHLQGCKCAKCSGVVMDKEYFIEKSKKIHGDKYNYSKVEYVDSRTKVCLICKRCGKEFWITPNSHISRGSGCECYAKEAISKSSRGELVYGVGVNDDERFCVDENGNYYPAYSAWMRMLRRCYCEDYKSENTTYKDACVCEDWLHYGNFRKWFEDDENGYKEGYELDKDIMVHGNKVYSPDKCLIVPRFINTLFTKSDKNRGDTMIGVSRTKQGTFSTRLSKGGEQVYLGRFNTEKEAFQAYKKEKEAYIKEIAEDYFNKNLISEKAYRSLLAYEVWESD